MRPSPIFLPLSFLAAACVGEPESLLEEAPATPPQASEILLQAVDAGTGEALADEELTVRHLVRFPITLDETGTERVPASMPFPIGYEVAWDSLVVELRLEAQSYHRLDTVLAVARGESVGPVTLPLNRRLSQTASQAGTGRASTPGITAPTGPGPPSPDPDADIDRTSLRAGDRAFREGRWAEATSAYLSLPPPPRRNGTYAREYAEAMTRLGESHIKLGEYAGALNALERGLEYPVVPHMAHLLLGQAQCAVGRFDEGRASAARIEQMAPSIPASEWGAARALAAYQRADCTYREFQRVEAALDILTLGGAAVRQYEAFLEIGGGLSPVPPRVSSAMEEARTRIDEVRERMRSGGEAVR